MPDAGNPANLSNYYMDFYEDVPGQYSLFAGQAFINIQYSQVLIAA